MPLTPGRAISITTTCGASFENCSYASLAFAAFADDGDVASFFQQSLIALADNRVIVDEQHTHGGGFWAHHHAFSAAGNLASKAKPRAGLVSIEKDPPIITTRSRMPLRP